MLSFHGLVIIATDNTNYALKDWGAFANTEVIVDNGAGSVSKFILDIIVYTKDLETLKAKLTKGTVCEIAQGDLIEYKSKGPEQSPIYFNRLKLRTHFDNMRFLKIPFYNESVADKLEINKEKQNVD